MNTISLQDFSVDVPNDWSDRSILVWSAKGTPMTVPPNFAIAHDELSQDENFLDYCTRQLVSLTSALEGFRLIRQDEFTLSGRPATEILFVWDTGAARMKQRQIFLPLTYPRVASFAGTAAETDFDYADKTFFQKIYDSLSLNGAEPN